MKITVKLWGVLRRDRFKEEVRCYPVGSTVQQVLDDLECPTPLLGAVLINEKHANVLNTLNEGDELTILPLLDGG
jgi:molybdopterin converting factor small subunit